MEGIMATIKSFLMDMFSHISYLVYLNLLWLFFSLIGAFVFGVGPATISLISLVNDYRENGNVSGFRKFFQIYKSSFFKANGYWLIIVGIFGMLLLNIRINNLIMNGLLPLTVLYLAFGIILFFLSIIFMFNYAKNRLLTWKDNIKLSLVMILKHPHLCVAILSTLYFIYLIVSQKSSLVILGSISISCLIIDFFHSKMVIGIKNMEMK